METRSDDFTILVRIKSQDFCMPPVRDALLVGAGAPIGCEAIRRAPSLLNPASFEHIELEDGVVGDILVRSDVVKRIPREQVLTMVLRRFKSVMIPARCLQLTIEVVLMSEDRL